MEKRFFNNWRIGLIGVFTLAILIYLPSLMGAAVWDDDDLITGQAVGGGTLAGSGRGIAASMASQFCFTLGVVIVYLLGRRSGQRNLTIGWSASSMASGHWA